MSDVWIILCCLLCVTALILLPWLLVWASYWWPRIRYIHADEEVMEAKAVYLHDAMPYLHNRYGAQNDPILPCSLYYVTFKVEGRAPMKFRVSKADCYRIHQGDMGTLIFRERLFIRFDAQNKAQEAIFKDYE